MLRPISRRGRFSAALFIASFVATLLLPIGTLARSVDAPAGALSSDAPPAERTPKLEGRGIRDAEAGRGQRPKEPLQPLDVDPTRAPTAAPNGPAAVTAAPAATLATSSGAPTVTSFAPWQGFDQAGAGANCTSGQNCGEREPPDSSVAVGPNDVVQAVNTDFRFTNREGVITTPAIDAYEFFEVATYTFEDQPITIDGISDARWIYDAKHDRWLGTVTAWHCDDDGDLTGDEAYGFVLAALSTSNDPTGEYYQFSIRYDLLPVDAMIGTSGDKIVVTASEYYIDPIDCTGSLLKDTPSLMTLGWADLMTYPAVPASRYTLLLPFESTLEAPRPAISPKGTSNTIYGVLPDGLSGSTSNVVYFTITGTISQSVNDITVTTTDLTTEDVVPAFASPPAPAQPGGTLASAVTRHPTHAIWQDDVLTFASTYPCDPVGGGSETRACARVTQLNTTTPTPTRIQDMLIGTTARDTWAPGVAQSQNGTLHVVYTQSSSSEGMSSYATYQLPSDSLNTVHNPLELADGGATHYNGSRWGDFTMPAQDPRDTNAVWQANQYTKSDGKWATRVSELQTAGATYVPIDPVRVLDSRIGNGLTGQFAGMAPRTLDIAGRVDIPEIPDDAVAITANLTVVGQTAAGYAAVTPVPTTTPPISTLNFPKGEVRGNNLTAPLSPTGGVSIVYMAASTARTHFVLDVTGYFLNDEANATYKPHGPVRVLDTRPATNTGLVGPFVAGQHYEVDVRGAGSPAVPAEAIAVTGNVAIVGQTAGGYVTLSESEPIGTPPTATVNFPAGDIRANGVTIRLNASGNVWAVFTAPPGASTHVVFDVTGYYVPDLSGARFIPMYPGRRMDTRFAAQPEGLTGKFVHGVPRTLVIEPYQGVPTNATAITGNLSVVGQSKAGYVSMTPDPPASLPPPVSTMNFPFGDIRGNGITGPLTAAGSVAFTYMASSGSTTHLILDITGYFR